MTKLTREQAAIIGAHTGIVCGPISDIKNYAEKLLGHPVLQRWFVEAFFVDKLKRESHEDFLSICADGD